MRVFWAFAAIAVGCSGRGHEPRQRDAGGVAQPVAADVCAKTIPSRDPHAGHFSFEGRSVPPPPPAPDLALPNETRRREAHAMMLRDPEDIGLHHNACGALVSAGARDSVPYLIHFLRAHPGVADADMLTCTLFHCLDALERITKRADDDDRTWRRWLRKRLSRQPNRPPPDPQWTVWSTKLGLMWDVEGQRFVETERNDAGQPHGVWRFYTDRGQLTAVETYENGMRTCHRNVAEYAEPSDAEWRQVRDPRGFSFAVPEPIVGGIVPGADSQVGVYRASDFLLSYDLGMYSNPLCPEPDETQLSSREEWIDGYRARVVTARLDQPSPFVPDSHFYAAAHIPGETGDLTFFVYVVDAQQLPVADRIVQSIQWPKGGGALGSCVAH